ncbi:hypothetical protein NQ117_16755 [Paenibacillus sp. SC116]|uniref:hypothetical protein n=1 Tax=Paenibacillus sp. SC116 TaxID=2968986 RepID=UPI00215B29BF|nr:hypothetical protein [Paenibacillus sp. SC116]MCR8845335.1 hypothetical protein [Paenibacillus sp. SC116]
MERVIVKAGLYGLILGLLFSIVYYPDVITERQSMGGYSSYEIPLREYVLQVLRNAIKISFSAMIVMGIVQIYKCLPKAAYSNKQFIWGVVKSFLIGSIIFFVIFSLIGMLT